ncbi:MAG: fibronectin type III domain-containing protein [Bacteroidetes bacterium]|nr:fibronectin type III domain-containing protein [Bacteroidota bacterium]
MKNICKSILMIAFLQVSMPGFSQCNAPTNLNTTYSNNVSTFTWDSVPGATEYNLELKFVYDPWGSGEGFTSTTNSFQLTGIYHSAELEWRVSTNCGTSTSANSASYLYTVPCPEPSALFANNITATTATVNWTAAAGYNTTVSNFAVYYRLANTSNAWTSAGMTSATSKTISGLLSSTAYEYRINQSCINSNSSTVIGQFTTAAIPCNVPTNLTVSGATSSQATVAWTIVSGGQSYTVEYKPTTSTTWISSSSVTTNSKLLTGLTAATLYDVRVKATCTNGYVSGYVSGQFTTYTATCMAYGVNGSEFIDQFTLGTINRTSGREVGGYRNTGLSTNLVKGSNSNPATISCGYNPGIVFGERYAVYIDFNNNGSFADNGERVAGPTSFSTGALLNFNISIPNNAPLGNRKMRVIIRRSTSSMAPCATGFQGEVEDYNVTIVSGSNKTSSDISTINEVNEIPVVVFPNPTSGKVNITAPDHFNLSFIEVMSMDGRMMERINAEDKLSNTIDISTHPAGVYIVNVVSEDNIKSSHRVLLTK